MLASVHFAGIRSLLDVKVDLQRFTVVVGPNGCGKSTLLNQIELLCRMSAPEAGGASNSALGWVGWVLDRVGPYGRRTSGTTSAMCWEGRDDAERALRIQVYDDPKGAWYDRTALSLARGESRLDIRSGAPAEAVQRFDAELRSELNWHAQRLRLSPDQISRPSPVRLTHLDPSGYGLPTVLKDLATDDPEAYAGVQRDLRAVVPAFRSLKFGKASDEQGVDCHSLDLEMVGGGRLSASQVSDGTLTALALLTATHNPALPSILLMDDLDHGLHLGAQFELVRAVREVMKARPGLQVIASTHSPVLLDSFEVSEVRVMALDAQGRSHVRPLAEHPKVDTWRAGFTAGELWANLGEAWVVGA